MADEKVKPVCRYGHGALMQEPGAWSFHGAEASNHPAEASGFRPNQLGFVITLHRCPTCGYMEMFDYPGPA